MLPEHVPVGLAVFYGALFLFIGIATPFWPVWLEAQGLGPADIGLVLAAGTAAQVVASPLLARVADHLGERRRR